MKIVEAVKNIASDYFQIPDENLRQELIHHAMLGAKWCCKDGKHSLYYIRDAIDMKYPIPEGGRNYEDAQKASAFEWGAYTAYDMIHKKE